MSEAFRGIFTIPATPFDENWQVDWEGLRSVLSFCVECGAHGIVWPVNASHFAVLSDEERLKGFGVVVEAVAGRAPVMLGVQGLSAEHAAMFARRANDVGADSVIAMAPYVRKLSAPGALVAYYQAIAQVVDVPICLQNHAVGSNMSISTLKRILTEVPEVEYVKEETMPVHHKLTALMELGMPNLKGVFGGAGGRYMLLEYPRGVCGQMPGCHVTDVMVSYWDALEADDWAEAKRIYGLLSPLYAIETVSQGAIYKEVLRRRGVIVSSRSRNAAAGQMDEYDHRALDDILRDLEPLFTWPGATPLAHGESHAVELSRTVDADASGPGSSGSGGEADPFDR